MCGMLHTRIRQLPGSGRVVTTGFPDPVSGEIPYPSHLYIYCIVLYFILPYFISAYFCPASLSNFVRGALQIQLIDWLIDLCFRC